MDYKLELTAVQQTQRTYFNPHSLYLIIILENQHELQLWIIIVVIIVVLVIRLLLNICTFLLLTCCLYYFGCRSFSACTTLTASVWQMLSLVIYYIYDINRLSVVKSDEGDFLYTAQLLDRHSRE